MKLKKAVNEEPLDVIDSFSDKIGNVKWFSIHRTASGAYQAKRLSFNGTDLVVELVGRPNDRVRALARCIREMRDAAIKR